MSHSSRSGRRPLLLAASLVLLSACATTPSVLELQGTILYEKPEIKSLSYTLTDSRETGGAAVVKVVLLGDPGLNATFDITPDIAARKPMKEISEGHYEGEYSFPREVAGGPYTVVGRLRHDVAGEIVRSAPEPLTIPLIEPGD